MRMLSNCFKRNLLKSLRAERFLSSNVCSKTEKSQHDANRSTANVQCEALDKELCLLVDENDRFLGPATKRECHQVGSKGELLLHRAFSVFLFNKSGDMLMQRRSSQKVTFPDHYTNACCSHPLYINGKEEDVVAAAQRRLHHELGIPPNEVDPQSFTFVSRFLYHDPGDGVWGEHELDHVLILQDDLKINPNPEEISEITYVSKNDFNEFISKLKVPVTPWFNIIKRNRLKLWWDNLQCLNDIADPEKIHRFMVDIK